VYLESSGHQNLEKILPEGSLPPGLPKGSKVSICIRANVSGEFRSPKLQKGAPGGSLPPEPPKSLKVVICTRGIVSGAVRSPKPEKKVLEGFHSPASPKGSKVIISTRGNVSGEFRLLKPEKGCPGEVLWEFLEAPGALRGLGLELYSPSQNKSFRRDTTVHICFAGFHYELRKQFHRCAYISKLEYRSLVNIESCIRTTVNIHRKHDTLKDTDTYQKTVPQTFFSDDSDP
jgi:hypothetical protein